MLKFSIKDYAYLAVVLLISCLFGQGIFKELLEFEQYFATVLTSVGTIFALWHFMPRITGKKFRLIPKD